MRKIGSGKRDMLKGGAHADRLDGRGETDVLEGRGGDDLLFGGAGIDVLDGGDGNDRLHGGADADLLLGQEGDDRLYGDQGQDLLMGGGGRDSLWGGEDEDVFFFDKPGPADRIMDHEAGETIVLIDLPQAGDFDGVRLSRLGLVEAGRWTILEFDGKAVARVRGDVDLSDVEIVRTVNALTDYVDAIL